MIASASGVPFTLMDYDTPPGYTEPESVEYFGSYWNFPFNSMQPEPYGSTGVNDAVVSQSGSHPDFNPAQGPLGFNPSPKFAYMGLPASTSNAAEVLGTSLHGSQQENEFSGMSSDVPPQAWAGSIMPDELTNENPQLLDPYSSPTGTLYPAVGEGLASGPAVQHGTAPQAPRPPSEATGPAVGVPPGPFCFTNQNIQSFTHAANIKPDIAFPQETIPIARAPGVRKGRSKSKPVPKAYCHLCLEGLSRKAGSLKRHLESSCPWTVHKQFPCTGCLRIFPRKDSLKRHRDKKVCGNVSG